MGSHSLACCNACLRGPRIRGEFLNVPFIRNLGVFGRIPSAARGLKRDRRLVAPGFSGKSNLKSRIYSESSTALASSNSFCHGNNLLYRAGSIGFSTRQVHCNATLNTPPVQLEQTKVRRKF